MKPTFRRIQSRLHLLVLASAILLAPACDDDSVGQLDPVLKVEPERLDFGTVELGQQLVKEIRVTNFEAVPATIKSVTVSDDCDGCFLAVSPPSQVEGLSIVDFGVRFRSVRLAVATGTVTIQTDDPLLPSTKVFLVGRGSDMRRPDIEVAPTSVDFGFVPAGGVAVNSFSIRSTGDNDLLIDRVRIVPENSPYRITTSTPTPEAPGRLVPGAQASVGVRAAFPETETGTVTAKIVIETNVPFDKNVPGEPGVVHVPIRALSNRPPIAVCGEDVTVEPWSRAQLDGSASYDQDNPPDNPLQYAWRLLTRPSGSTAQLERANTAQPSFWVDITGTYELELTVTDSLGLPSQTPCLVSVEALPTNAVRMELTWDHPDSDLDLHLIQSNGAFCDCATDCHYRDCARRPNWFPQSPGSNPRLDVDDRSGFGPETIDIDGEGAERYIPDGRYQIAVHYYASNEGISSWPTARSIATLRVFIYGLLAAEFTQPLDNDGDVWVVGDLVWPDRVVEPNGAVIPGQMCGAF